LLIPQQPLSRVLKGALSTLTMQYRLFAPEAVKLGTLADQIFNQRVQCSVARVAAEVRPELSYKSLRALWPFGDERASRRYEKNKTKQVSFTRGRVKPSCE